MKKNASDNHEVTNRSDLVLNFSSIIARFVAGLMIVAAAYFTTFGEVGNQSALGN